MNNLDDILEIIAIAANGRSADEMLAMLTESITHLVGAAGCTILERDPDTNTLVIRADYLAPDIITPFAGVNHIGAAYPLDHYPVMAGVLQNQTPLAVYNDDPPPLDEAEKNLLEAFQWYGALIVPILVRGQAVGVVKLAAANNVGQRFTADQVTLCQALAPQAGLLLENARLQQEGAEGQLHAEALQVIGRALAAELDYARIARDVAEFAYRLTGAAVVYVAVPKDDDFELVAATGLDEVVGTVFHLASFPPAYVCHPLLSRAAQTERPIVVANIHQQSEWLGDFDSPQPWRWASMAAAPLLAHNRPVGVLAAYATKADYFKAGDVATLMSLASQAAIAIQNARLFAELDAQREALRQVSLRLVNAQEDERRRISRELHDELGQALTALKINLDLARRALPEDGPPKLHQSIHEASSLAVQTLQTARDMSLALHPAMLDDLGLVAALRWEIDRYEQRTGQAVFLEANLGEVALQPELQITVYRIVTEALTNAARHAQASDIKVTVTVTGAQITVNIVDNGRGFNVEKWQKSPQERQSLGLVSMRERAELLGGSLEIESSPGQGTSIMARLPLQP
jgi:signal transduction histidine kinase